MVGVGLLVVASALVGGLSLEAEPSRVVSGPGATAVVRIQVDGPLAQGPAPLTLELTSPVGTVGPVRALGNGRYEATFTSPPVRYPQVALLLVEARSGTSLERGWLSLPLLGTQTLKLKTKPSARVEVRFGKEVAATAQANPNGNCDVPVQVPPGFSHAEIRSVDRLGNKRTRQVFLDPPPYATVRFAPPPPRGASWTETDGVALELFAVRPDGSPHVDGVSLEATQGALPSVTSPAPGVYQVRYVAPRSYAGGTAQLRAWPQGTAPAHAQTVELAMRGGPATQLTLTPSTTELHADGERRVQLVARALDEAGNPADFTAPVKVASELGSVTKTPDGLFLELPPRFGGRERLTVRAQVGTSTAEATLSLHPGAAARAVSLADGNWVRAGETTPRPFRVEDAHGNPVPGLSLEAHSDGVERHPVRELGRGTYAVDVTLPASRPVGEMGLAVQSGAAAPLLEERLSVLPQRRFGVFVGAVAGAQSNFVLARGMAASLHGGVRPTRFPVELLAVVGGMDYPSRGSAADGASGVSLRTHVRALQAGAGLRYVLELGPKLGLHLSTVAGLQRTWSEISVAPDSGVGDYAERQVKNSPFVRGATGVSFALGPGRVLGEVQGSYAAPGGQLGTGNIGGLTLGGGYELYVR